MNGAANSTESNLLTLGPDDQTLETGDFIASPPRLTGEAWAKHIARACVMDRNVAEKLAAPMGPMAFGV